MKKLLLLALSLCALIISNAHSATTTTITQTCTVNGVRVDCATGLPIDDGLSTRRQLCPERVYEPIYGHYCDYRIGTLLFRPVKLAHAYDGAGFAAGTGLKTAWRMNDNTDIVGSAIGTDGQEHAVRVQIGANYYSDHYFMDLGSSSKTNQARAINNLMTIVGEFNSRPGIWHSQLGFARDLYIPDTTYGRAIDIARNRMYTEYVTGYASRTYGRGIAGFVWSYDGLQETVEEIGEPNTYVTTAAINDSKIVVGTQKAQRFAQTEPFIWRSGTLSALSGFPADARSILPANINNNASAKVVGRYYDGATRTWTAFVWQNDAVTALPSLSGRYINNAAAITDAGDIVGESGGKAAIWRDGEVYDLNELLDVPFDAQLRRAIDMNRQGRILVLANDGYFYVLVPSEEIPQ